MTHAIASSLGQRWWDMNCSFPARTDKSNELGTSTSVLKRREQWIDSSQSMGTNREHSSPSRIANIRRTLRGLLGILWLHRLLVPLGGALAVGRVPACWLRQPPCSAQSAATFALPVANTPDSKCRVRYPILGKDRVQDSNFHSDQLMRVVSTRDATRLTGLSTNKLREWTSRRALIRADIRPKNQGSPAKYSWQTILLLRIAVTLRDGFHLELQAYRPVFAGLRSSLRKTSFVGLWGKSLAIHADHRWVWLDDAETRTLADALVIRLDPHLEILSQGFALPRASASSGQLDLFPVQAVTPVPAARQRPRALHSAPTRRRSA